MNFGLATLRRDGAYIGALQIGDYFWPLDLLQDAGIDVPSTDVKQLLENWSVAFPRLQEAAAKCGSGTITRSLAIARDVAVLDVPIRFPNKLLAVGANYAGHLAEMGMPPKRMEPMQFFLKPPTTAMVGPGKTVIMPLHTQSLDWEIELAVVIGARLSHVSPEVAMAGVAGYAIGIDLSARDLLIQPNSALKFDMMRGKCQDSMCPFGSVVRPAMFVPNPHDLMLKLSVNGVMRQHASTSEMLFRIEEQLSIISEIITLEPGDVVLTGTPSGSGAHHGIYLQPGDQLTAEIEQVGTLAVEIVASSHAMVEV